MDTYDAVIRPMLDGPAFPLYGVEERHVRRYLDQPARRQGAEEARCQKPEKPKSEATKKSYAARFRIFLDWCVETRLIARSPAPAPRKGKEGRRRDLPEFLSPEDYDRLLRAVEADAEVKGLAHGNRWLLDAVRLAVGTGLRRGELCALRWGAVDLPGRMLHVRDAEGFTTKSGRERAVPLVGDAHAVLVRLDAERRGCGQTSRKALVLSGGEGGAISGSYLFQAAPGVPRARRAAGGDPVPQPPAHVRLVVGPARRRPLPAEGGARPRRRQDDDEARPPPAGVPAGGGGAAVRHSSASP